ncbi:MAG: 50S ribosomal protein L20 [Candidatus Vogelbacteria bacterium]|nr:50S ribosomal protein L20 [Candidatus Vogelbacteria bacterium]
MPRVKRGTTSLKRRRKILRAAKGFRFGRSKKERAAREALLHAGAYALAHRRDKKGDFRRLWQIKINAAVRPLGLSYSRFINLLKQNKIELDRKIMAQLAEHEPAIFSKIVKTIQT